MPLPRFCIRTLMIAVAVAGMVFAGLAAVAGHFGAMAESAVVLRSNFWIDVSVTPLGWILLAVLATITAVAVVAILRAVRQG